MDVCVCVLSHTHSLCAAGKHQLSQDKLLVTLLAAALLKCLLLSVLSLCEMSEIQPEPHLYISSRLTAICLWRLL